MPEAHGPDFKRTEVRDVVFGFRGFRLMLAPVQGIPAVRLHMASASSAEAFLLSATHCLYRSPNFMQLFSQKRGIRVTL